MARALPPVAWFRAFESAARHLSFTAAAEELGLTQSAISQNVRSLEVRFSTILFERKPRGLALTDAGRRLLPDVTAAMGSLSNAAGIFEGASESGLLTVAASVSFAQFDVGLSGKATHMSSVGLQRMWKCVLEPSPIWGRGLNGWDRMN